MKRVPDNRVAADSDGADLPRAIEKLAVLTDAKFWVETDAGIDGGTAEHDARSLEDVERPEDIGSAGERGTDPLGGWLTDTPQFDIFSGRHLDPSGDGRDRPEPRHQVRSLGDARQQDVICVEEDHLLRFGQFQPSIAGGRGPGVGLPDEPDAVHRGPERWLGAIIDDDDSPDRREGESRCDSSIEEVLVAEGRDDDVERSHVGEIISHFHVESRE